MAKSLFAEGIKDVSKMPDEGLRSEERQAASIFLSALMSVEAFRVTLFEGLGLKVGQGSRLSCLSNFAYLTNHSAKRPSKESHPRLNNLFYLQTSKYMWSALVLTRVDGIKLEPSEIAHCAEIARQIRVNAVLTISDSFTARLNILPVKIDKSVNEGLEIYHLSWGRIYSASKQVLIAAPHMPEDERAILSDFITYMENETRCLKASSRLLPETSTIARSITSGAEIDPTQESVVNVVASWHENLKFMAFKLRDKFNCDVALPGADVSISQAKEQLSQDARRFSQSSQLLGAFSITKGHALISLKVDLLRRTANFSMLVNAVGESYKSASHLSLLLEKLKSSNAQNIYIKALFNNRATPKQAALELVMNDHTMLDMAEGNLTPDGYEVLLVRDIANNLDTMDLLVEQIDEGILDFYEHVAQHLSAMVSPRELGPLEKTKQFDAALVKAVNENIDSGGAANLVSRQHPETSEVEPQEAARQIFQPSDDGLENEAGMGREERDRREAAEHEALVQRELARREAAVQREVAEREAAAQHEMVEREAAVQREVEKREAAARREAAEREAENPDSSRDFSSDLLVDVLGKLDTFKHR